MGAADRLSSCFGKAEVLHLALLLPSNAISNVNAGTPSARNLHEARDLMPEVPHRWTPHFLIQWRERKAHKILTALLNDPTPAPKIKASIRRALNVESRHDKRIELTVAISQTTGAYLMGLG